MEWAKVPMGIVRIDHRLSSLQMPAMGSFDPATIGDGDVLVMCSGFENRSVHCFNKAVNEGSTNFYLINIDYRPEVEENNFETIQNKAKQLGIVNSPLVYDRRNPANFWDEIQALIPSDANRVLFDISGMSRLLIVQLIVGVLESKTIPNPTVLYCEAEVYPPDQETAFREQEEYDYSADEFVSFISSGVYDLTVVPELCSINELVFPVRLVAFPSFNPMQLHSAMANIQPTHLSLIHGVPPLRELKWRTDVIKELNTVTHTLDLNESYMSTFDYRETLKELLMIYDHRAVFERIIISPTGSKMQSVAVGLLRGCLKDIQIVYPTPLSFTNPEAHTTGVASVNSLNLNCFVSICHGSDELLNCH